MKRFCYGIFAKILLWGISKPKFQTKLHILLLSILVEEYSIIKVDPAHASRWINCHDDVSSILREEALAADLKAVSARFEKDIVPLVNPNKLQAMIEAICEIILKDDEIKPDIVIDSLNYINKEDLNKPITNIADFLAGAFVYGVGHVNNREGKDFALLVNDFLAEFPKADDGIGKDVAYSVAEVEPENKVLPKYFKYLALTACVLVLVVTGIAVAIRFAPRYLGLVMMAAGAEHSLALHSDGSLWTWGRNEFGQLGDGTMICRVEPVKIMCSVTYVSTGMHYSFAIREDGSLWAWGRNEFGQLGDGTTVIRNFPVMKMENVRYVSSGWGHTLALDFDGVLWAWGYNADGQVGDGTRETRYQPVRIMDIVKYVSAGQDHSLAIRADGSLWAWGCNIIGQLGDGTTNARHEPVQILTSVRQVSGGAFHTLAIREDGKLYAWGRNMEGQVGDGARETRYTPVRVMDSVYQISAGGLHSMVVCSDGNLLAWGDNTTGQVGIGEETMQPILEPLLILEAIGSIAASRGSNGYSFAIDRRGNLWAWGANTHGQLGGVEALSQPSPAEITMPAALIPSTAYFPFTQQTMVSAGYAHSLAVTGDGALWAWGSNNQGQLGDGTNISRSEPVKIMDSVAYVSAGFTHSLAIKTDGSLWAWGDNIYGQLGDGTTEHRNIPVRIMSTAKAVSAGSFHSIALDIYGNVWAWGTNHWGELGDGTNYDRHTPVKIMESAKQVYAGDLHSMAVDIYGNLWFWGYWPYVQYSDEYLPRIVLESVAYISAGLNHVMIIKTDGSLWAWGCNRYGQLGDGTTTDRYEPVMIIEDSVVSVSAGDNHTVAVLFMRTGERILRTWGNNAYGQLGDGTTLNRHSPVWAMSPILAASAGGNHTMALGPDGSIWAWGDNWNGQVGSDNILNRNRPTNIMNSVSHASAGYRHTFAIQEDGSMWAWGGTPRQEGPTEITDFEAFAISTEDYRLLAQDGDIFEWGLHDLQCDTISADAITLISMGRSHTLAVDNNNVLWAWGFNGFGRLGDGTTVSRDEPVAVMEAVAAISAGRYHSHAICTGGSLWAWGSNRYGQLGDTTRRNSLVPLEIMSNVSLVSGGGYHTLAIDIYGDLWAWGNNDYGQLGDGTNTRRYEPVMIMENIVYASAGLNHSVAIDINGNLWVWGRIGDAGFVSDRTTIQATPIQIEENIIAVSITQSHSNRTLTYAIANDSTMIQWGDRGPSIGMEDVVAVTSGGSHNILLTGDGALWTWGSNRYGQLGRDLIEPNWSTDVLVAFPARIMDGVKLP